MTNNSIYGNRLQRSSQRFWSQSSESFNEFYEFHLAYPKIHLRIIAVNPLSKLYINRKFQKLYPLAFDIATERLLWNLSVLHIRMMNGVISWYVLALQHLFHFTECVSFPSIYFLFFTFFVEFNTCWGI